MQFVDEIHSFLSLEQAVSIFTTVIYRSNWLEADHVYALR